MTQRPFIYPGESAFKPPLEPSPPRSDEDAIVCAEASAEALRVLRLWQARCAELIRRIQEMSVSHAAEITDLRRINEALRGTSGVAEFAGLLNDAVTNQGVTLTATNTTTGRQVQALREMERASRVKLDLTPGDDRALLPGKRGSLTSEYRDGKIPRKQQPAGRRNVPRPVGTPDASMLARRAQ